MKRAMHSGTVYKLSGKRRNPWIARLSQGYNEEGGRIWYTVGYFRTKTEAVIALDEVRVKPLPERPNISLRQIFDEWKIGAYKNLSKSSVEMYEAAFKHLSSIQGFKFTELRAGHYQQIINNLILSYSSLHKIKVLIKQLYDYAIINDILNKDYSKGIKLPKQNKKEKEIFTDAEIKKLFDNDNIPWVDSILCLIYTGFRVQELLNVTKFDVDFKNNVIKGGSKTEAGKNRIVPIHPKILGYIKNRYDSCKNYLFEMAGGGNDAGNYRRRHYNKVLAELGIPMHTPHCCRHTCATLLARSGADTLAIKQILGHTNYAFTADVYTHSDVDFLKDNMKKI